MSDADTSGGCAGVESEPGVDEYDGEGFLETLPAIIAVLTLGLGVTAAITGAGELAGVIFVVGWLLLTPLSAILADTKQVRSLASRLSWSSSEHGAETAADEREAALEALKQRYARGEIDEAEFERRTALLLENETLDDVAARTERTDGTARTDRTDGTERTDVDDGGESEPDVPTDEGAADEGAADDAPRSESTSRSESGPKTTDRESAYET